MRRASVAAAASAASLVLLRGEDQQHPLFSMPLALCEQHAQQDASPEARLKRWLESRGCQLSNVEVRPSTVGEESGFGLFVAPSAQAMHSARKRWWWPFGSPPPFATVATFPMSNAITAENILADPQVGGRFGYLLEHGALNERDIIIGHIAVERARGAKSPLAPWIDMLPKESHSPLSWTEAELDELQGTTLYAAAGTLKRRLAASWSEMQPVLQAVASQSGTERNPSFADLLWAHCVFWSRGHSLPVPKKEGAASSLVAKDPKGAPSFMHVHEGLVPGLDFANHSDIPQCWWEVSTHPQASPPRPINSPPQPSTTTTTNTTTSTSSSTGSTHSPSISAQKSEHSTKAGEGDSSRQLASSILLQLHRGATVAPGDELCINYGDTKSNEELLLLYGFVYDPAHTPVPQHSSKSPGSLRRRTHLPGCNPADFSMIACPLAPASEWDELMQRRMQLLMCQGLKPQFFLAASGVDASAAASGKPTAPVPIDVLETLEVFVLEPEEVDERLEAVLLPMAAKEERRKQGTMPPDSSALLDLKALSHRLDKKKISPQEAATLARQLGLRMAAVSAFVGLLELRMAELEAPQVPSDASLPAGTGPLEADLALLDQHCQAMESRASAATPQTQQQQQQQQQEKQKGGGVQGVQQHSGVQPLLHRKHCAVVYRAGQKQIVRAYAVGAREELSQVMRLQRAVSDLQSRGS